MTTVVAFQAARGNAGALDAHWERVENPPWIVSCGPDDLVVEDAGAAGCRVLVNGFPVIALHVLAPGDFVRIVAGAGGESRSFRYAGRTARAVEPGAGRRCAFTGAVIGGMAVRCGVCGQIVSEAVVEQVGTCVCGTSLREQGTLEAPGEDML